MSLELDQKLYHLAKLQISRVAKADSGEYKAIAVNKHGQGVATINLNFEGGDKLKYASAIAWSTLNPGSWKKKTKF